MVGVICILVLTKPGSIDNYLVLLILFLNIFKAILSIFLYRNKISIIFLYLFFFSFVHLSNILVL